MTPEALAAIAKLVAAAKAADNADCHKNSVHAKTGNSLAYWEAVRTSDELSSTFKDLATPEIILTLADALAEAEKLLKDTIRLTAAKQPTSSNSVYGYGIDEYEDD